MSLSKQWLPIIITIFAVSALLLSGLNEVRAVNCNSLTPTNGNCGTETTCVDRDVNTCTTTYANYYQDYDGINCGPGTSGNFCEQSMVNDMKCTCEWNCQWSVSSTRCVKAGKHNDGMGNHICATQKKYESQGCSIGGM